MKTAFRIAVSLIMLALPGVAFSASPPPSPPPGLLGGTFNVSANTNSTTGNIDYQVNNTQTTSQAGTVSTSGSGRRSGTSSCVGQSIAQANITFYANGMSLIPQYNGQMLPMVGSVPGNQNTDPNAPGSNPITGSNAVEYIVVCNGVPTGYGMFVPGTGGSGGPGAAPTPAQIQAVAQSVAGSIAMPNVTISTSPVVGGVVNLPTWFWASGYNGGPIAQTRNALGVSIEVDATPTSYTWSFGDGSSPMQTNSLGVPWPQTGGSVVHTYTAKGAGYSVSCTFNLSLTYRVNRGAPTALPALQRAATLSYPVEEINTVITAR